MLPAELTEPQTMHRSAACAMASGRSRTEVEAHIALAAPINFELDLGSPHRLRQSAHWVKVKNPKAPAVKREAEEDWGR